MSEYNEAKSRRTRYWVIGIVLVAVLFAITAVGMWVARSVGTPEEATESASYDGISALDIDAGAGDINITATDSDEVKVDRSVRWRGGTEPESSTSADDGTLRIDENGCEGFAMECWVEYRIEMPADTSVDIEQGAGNISTSGVSGPQQFKVAAGDVKFVESSGDVTVENDAGDITAESLESENIDIEQSAGNATLDFANAPASVQSATDAGNIEVAVPGNESYAVDADSDAGDVDVSAPEKESSDYQITAHSSAGNVTVRDRRD